MTQTEILRRLNNLARFGTITETKSVEGKALARVKVGERVSDFMPVKSFSNSFRKHWIPIYPEEQVLVISPFGEADSGVILRGIFNKDSKEPSGANEYTEIIEYSDGTKISYDTQAKELKIDASDKVTIICVSATIKASESINLDTPLTKMSGDLEVAGNITDSKGDLTNHPHSDSDGGTSLPRS